MLLDSALLRVATLLLYLPFEGWCVFSTRIAAGIVRQSMRAQRLTIALVFALMLASGFFGLHLAQQAADRWPDPRPQLLMLRR
ncbi:hypothetical protein [Reyranella sp. CPCC 100927]|uniref:hypothetical protein n=1 Tax=Reyranella sp. CPCC 100927 TaxID=2599616 RepID=UPI0011B74640|nr:hypothetical protein [Reyranella sp. CPCC 100927]TWT15723.1 hypothetical protein FQU96_05105 [Reyranella sp. CPCC 100927]